MTLQPPLRLRPRLGLLAGLALAVTACSALQRPKAVNEPRTTGPRQGDVRLTPTPIAQDVAAKPKNEAEWGEAFYKKGDYRRAVAYLSEAVKKDQGNAKLWRNLGSAYAMGDDFDNAILCFERALKRNPADIKSYYNLSLVNGWKGTLPEAEAAAKKGLELRPNHSGLHSSLGNVYADENKEDDALQEYATALQLNPKDPVTHFNKGGLHFKRRELRLAESEYAEVLRIEPKDVEAAQNLAAVYILQDRLDDAEKLNRWVIKQAPKDEDTLENAYFNLGIIYDRHNKLEQALNMYKLALQVAPWDAAAYVNTAVILERLKRRSEALAYWEKYQRLFPASRRADEIGKRIKILRQMVDLEKEKANKGKSKKK
jgi:tetratricopeptide (TPR) repeat protein